MRQSPTALGWPYPLSSPSYRFTQVNNFVRNLDTRFAALSDNQKSEWNHAAALAGYWGICDWWLWLIPIPPEFASTSIQVYRAVNCSRLVIGIEVIDQPPPLRITPLDVSIVKDGSTPLNVRWFRAGGDPGYPVVGLVRAVGLNHSPERGPAGQKFRWSSVKSMPYNTAVDISDAVDQATGDRALPACEVSIVLCAADGPAFAGAQLSYSAPYDT